jgi:hypothetical protein
LGEPDHPPVGTDLERVIGEALVGVALVGARAGRDGDELVVCDLTGVGAQDAAKAGEGWRRLDKKAL